MLSSPNDSFNPIDFYTFASQLYSQNADEAIYRTIIGRAYYSVILCARDYAKITNASGSVHSDVIKHFQVRDRTIYNRINTLKDLRTKADYQLSEAVQKREAGESLRLAEQILKTLKFLS